MKFRTASEARARKSAFPDIDYLALAELRHQIRRFLVYSEREARGAGPARGARVAFDQTHAGDRAESSMNAPLEPASELPDDLGDFTATRRTLVISALAIGIGAVGAVAAFVLLRMIGLFTNLFFYQR